MARITRGDVNTQRVVPSGAWCCFALVNGYLMTRTFLGYSKREAVALFVSEANAGA